MDAKKNFAISTVATAPSPATSGTSLTVAAGEGLRFPATPFNAVVAPANTAASPDNAEVIRVTTRATDALSVIVRAQEDSTARSIVVGDRIYAGPTVKSLEDIEDALTDVEDDVAALPPLQSGYVVGQYYPAFLGTVVGAGAGAPTKDQLYMTPFVVYRSQAFDRIATYITANGTATCVDRLGIYNDNAGVPGTVLLDAGTVATDAGAAAIKAITISITLTPGIYWSAICPQVANAGNHNRYTPMSVGGYFNAAFSGQTFGPTSITGALPNNPTLGAAITINPPTIALRAA